MSKKKKRNKDPWVSTVNSVLNRKRAKRELKVPKDYILSVADNLWRTQPCKEIIVNTLTDMSTCLMEKAYMKARDDMKFFKDQTKREFEQEWQEFATYLSDKVLCKDGSVGTFADWQKAQRDLKRSNNQQKK